MKFDKLIQLAIFLPYKLCLKLFYIVKKRQQFLNTKIEIGANSSIDLTAILSTSENGLIKLAGNNFIGRNVEIGTAGEIVLGEHTSIQDRCILLGDIEVGAYCLFATDVYISSGRHYFNHIAEYYIADQDEIVSKDPQLKKNHSRKVTVEDDCWLGKNVVVMAGLTIGKGAIVGANSVVTKSVEPYNIVAGSPAKFIKKRLEFYPPKKIKVR